MIKLFVGDLRSLRAHAFEKRSQVLRKRLFASIGRLSQKSFPFDVRAKLEQAQSPQSELVERLDVGLRSPNRFCFAGTASETDAQKQPSQAPAHGPTVVDVAGEPN